MSPIRTAATIAPTGKPDMLVGLALSLSAPDEVPQDLREKFASLIMLAK